MVVMSNENLNDMIVTVHKDNNLFVTLNNTRSSSPFTKRNFSHNGLFTMLRIPLKLNDSFLEQFTAKKNRRC